MFQVSHQKITSAAKIYKICWENHCPELQTYFKCLYAIC